MFGAVDLLDERSDREKAVIAKALDAMWAKFLPEIRERAKLLDAAAKAVAAGTLNESLRGAAQSAAHKLAGTLGTFGLQRGTELARELEKQFARGEIGVEEAPGLSKAAVEIRTTIETRPSS